MAEPANGKPQPGAAVESAPNPTLQARASSQFDRATAGMRMKFADLLGRLPPEWPHNPRPKLQRALQELAIKVVVLDDDPTGTQTVHGVPVLTSWSIDELQAELTTDLPAFFLLTNTRSLTLPEAQAINEEIGRNLLVASRRSGQGFVTVSRSDSTLRGHFPGEVDALLTGLAHQPDACLLIPFFLEGQRYTVDDVHYVVNENELVPVGESEFARDGAFGYKHSNLRHWVEEKSCGRIPATSVGSISLEDIRLGGPDRVARKLEKLHQGVTCIVNLATVQDLETFTLGLLQAEACGKRFVYRTAASFVPVRAGIPPRPLLTLNEITATATGGGLIVVGSYVPTTSAQVRALSKEGAVHHVEVDVHALLAKGSREDEVARAARIVNHCLQKAEDVMVYTTREFVHGDSAEVNLSIGQRISSALIEIVRAVEVRPRYLLAKGGITSSDIATNALEVKRALVKGQMAAGVPVWELGPESRYPGLSYIVFPGNVGGPAALADLVMQLKM